MKRIQNFYYLLAILIISIIFLYYSKPFLIPFILSLIFWFIIRETKQGLKKISYICRKIPEGILTFIAALILFIFFGFVVKMITNNIQSLSTQASLYEANLSKTIDQLDKMLEINSMSYFAEITKNFDFSTIIKSILNSVSELFNNTLMILFYTVFLLIEETVFDKKIKAVYANNNSAYQKTSSLLLKIENSISNYLTLKAIVSFITGTLSYFILYYLDIEAPAFWAFLIFLLNFIPTVGSLIATTFPAIFAVFQYGEFSYFLYVLGLVGLVQMIIGNFVEPKIMGSSLNMSSLVVIIALSFWGAIWGITGMILSVPITVIAIILCAHFKSTRPLAIFLSEKGDIEQLLLPKNVDEFIS